MAEETLVVAPAPVTTTTGEEVVVVETKEKDVTPPLTEESEAAKPVVVADVVVEEEKPKTTTDDDTKGETPIDQSVSFKEESNVVADLQDPQKKALDEFKLLIQEAMNKREFETLPPPPHKEEVKPAEKVEEEAKPAEPEPEPEPVAAVTEEEKKPAASDAPAEEPSKLESEEAAAAAVVVDETTTSQQVKEEVKVEDPIAVVETTTVVVEEDGTKTVEAIEETIVAVQKEAEATPDPVAEPKEEETTTAAVEEEPTPAEPITPEQVSIFGIPLLADERSDVILLKFLRARDFKVKEAFTMIRNTVRWRKEFGIDGLLDEDLGTDLDKVVFMKGFDKEGHPVCYNAYGEFQNKDLYQKTFSDEEKSNNFLRWRIQFLEKSIRKLDFSPGGICTIVQVNDLKNSPGPFKSQLRQATNQALSLLQDNYPEFVARQIFINVPWWYLAFNRMISPFLTVRTKSKFVFAGPSKSAETLFKYISPEQVPVHYGGLSNEDDQEFSTTDAVTEITIKPTTKQTVEFPVTETCLLVWELRVLGWDVSYGAEFVPSAEDGYTVIVQKTRKVTATDEPVIVNSFKISEPGKIVVTIDNTTSKKKKLLYRSKTKPTSD